MQSRSLTASFHRMNARLRKVVYKISRKQEKVFAFIDAQNIAKGVEGAGWKINWSAFRDLLAKKYNVSHAYIYIGYMPEHEKLYAQLNANGFIVQLKQVVYSSQQEDSHKKGNVDVDLTIGVWQEYDNFKKAIIVSGDGDFASLIEHLIDNNKLKNVIVPRIYSSLFKKYDKYIVELDSFRADLTYTHKPAAKTSRNSMPPMSRIIQSNPASKFEKRLVKK